MGRAVARKAAENKTEPIPTIGDSVLKELRELKTMLTFLRDEGPDSSRGSLASLGVLQGLSDARQRRLSALVTEFYAQGDAVKWLAPQRRQRQAWANDGPRRLRILKKKMVAAQSAMKAVRDHLKKVGVLAGGRLDGPLSQALAVFDPTSLHEAEGVVSSLAKTEPSQGAILALYDFFVSQCGLQKNEAEVRVGKIGNYFWDWNVAVTEHYERHRGPVLTSRGAESLKGCDAVHQAIRRRKRTRDTPNKTR
jgi:hypothetical protein